MNIGNKLCVPGAWARDLHMKEIGRATIGGTTFHHKKEESDYMHLSKLNGEWRVLDAVLQYTRK